MSKPSWKAVAMALAARLQYNEPCATHATPEDACPFCADTKAFEMFRRRLEADGETWTTPGEAAAGLPSVGIQDLQRGEE